MRSRVARLEVVDATTAAVLADIDLVVEWSDDPRLIVAIDGDVATYTGQAELAEAIRSAVDALEDLDPDSATARSIRQLDSQTRSATKPAGSGWKSSSTRRGTAARLKSAASAAARADLGPVSRSDEYLRPWAPVEGCRILRRLREPDPGCQRRAEGPDVGARAPQMVAVATADREYFDEVAPEGTVFPDEAPPRTFPLEGREFLIGRHSTSRRIAPEIDLSGAPEDFGISHTHAWLQRMDDGRFAIVDAGSVNGTTVNTYAQPIAPHERVALNDGDLIHLGFWTTIRVGALSDSLASMPLTGGPAPASDVAWLVSASLAGVSRIQQRSAQRYEEVIERFQDIVAAVRAQFNATSLGPVDDSAVLAVLSPAAASDTAIALLHAGRSLTESFHTGIQIRLGIDARRVERWAAQASPADQEASLALARASNGGQVLVSAAAAGVWTVRRVASNCRAAGIGLAPHAEPLAAAADLPTRTSRFRRRVNRCARSTIRRTTCPEQGTDFIGRHREIAELTDILRSSRLCSISGPGVWKDPARPTGRCPHPRHISRRGVVRGCRSCNGYFAGRHHHNRCTRYPRGWGRYCCRAGVGAEPVLPSVAWSNTWVRPTRC